VAVPVALHVPPGEASVSAVVPPEHITNVPLIAAGAGFTVTTAEAVQLPAVVVNVMSAVPAETPVTTPVPETTVATPVAPLLQVPAMALVSVVVAPTQTVRVPLIVPGNGFTVTTATV